jgi:hypothetical protein
MMIISAQKLAFGFLGLLVVGSIGVVLFSPGAVVGTTVNIGGLQVETLSEPFSMEVELQGAQFADEILGLHQPALPIGFEFEGTINLPLIEEESAPLLAEILASQPINGEQKQGGNIFVDPIASGEAETNVAAASSQMMAVTQAQREIQAEHRYLGGCNGY